MSDICILSGEPVSSLCCSVHQAASSRTTNHFGPSYMEWWPPYAPAILPMGSSLNIRQLPSLNVPHIVDEDPVTGASSGPLSSGLGFKLGPNNRPIYKGWLNEASHL
ncbi:unnamed protein product [Protopolystoma xenopodis]|uniref:Uncharacterized protein n=1 Tax=Protopolystoma xenopodis TaxID=117903 RepID=A0A448XGA3_9PLAT|nr:unnamed protein product [Protopolystoma xenopodis]